MLLPEVRHRIARRAGHACEYCLIHHEDTTFSHELDHVISRKHGGSDDEDNLAYACFLCNRYKGSDLASLDEEGQLVALFHPRQQNWADHFQLDGARIAPRTACGQATVQLLRMNDSSRVSLRSALLEGGRYPPGGAR